MLKLSLFKTLSDPHHMNPSLQNDTHLLFLQYFISPLLNFKSDYFTLKNISSINIANHIIPTFSAWLKIALTVVWCQHPMHWYLTSLRVCKKKKLYTKIDFIGRPQAKKTQQIPNKKLFVSAKFDSCSEWLKRHCPVVVCILFIQNDI